MTAAKSPSNGHQQALLRELTARFEERNRFYEERDRRYEERFAASEKAVAAALAAQDKATTTNFAASEKAVLKAEEAQREYNIRSNEFRGQLDDQNKIMSTEMLRRAEADNRFAAVSEKIDEVKLDVSKIREVQSGTGGRNDADERHRQQANTNRALTAGIIIALIGWALTIVGAVFWRTP